MRQPVDEAGVLRLGIVLEVDLLVVGDHLTEFAELVVDQFAASRVPRDCFLSHIESFEEVEIEPLDVVDRVPHVGREVAPTVQQRHGALPVGAAGYQLRGVP